MEERGDADVDVDDQELQQLLSTLFGETQLQAIITGTETETVPNNPPHSVTVTNPNTEPGPNPGRAMGVEDFLRHYILSHGLSDPNDYSEGSTPPPASQEAVDGLKNIRVAGDSIGCTVCLKDFSDGESAKMMPCEHYFHDDCIVLWLQKTNSCPVCRFELPTSSTSYEDYKKMKREEKRREEDTRVLHNSMYT